MKSLWKGICSSLKNHRWMEIVQLLWALVDSCSWVLKKKSLEESAKESTCFLKSKCTGEYSYRSCRCLRPQLSLISRLSVAHIRLYKRPSDPGRLEWRCGRGKFLLIIFSCWRSRGNLKGGVFSCPPVLTYGLRTCYHGPQFLVAFLVFAGSQAWPSLFSQSSEFFCFLFQTQYLFSELYCLAYLHHLCIFFLPSYHLTHFPKRE